MATESQILDRMYRVAAGCGSRMVYSPHLLTALLEFPDDPAVAVLLKSGCSLETLKKSMTDTGMRHGKLFGIPFNRADGYQHSVVIRDVVRDANEEHDLDRRLGRVPPADGRYIVEGVLRHRGDHTSYLSRVFREVGGKSIMAVLEAVKGLPRTVQNVVIIE